MYSGWDNWYSLDDDFLRFYSSNIYKEPKPTPSDSNVIDLVQDASGAYTSVNII